jgi:4'-phosphopantetheinyl transferase
VSTAGVAVWRVPHDPSSAPAAGALAELSGAERERAALFATDALRNRWFHAHVALRRILARELGVAPAMLTYDIADVGKPFLGGAARGALEFNLSDSGDLALIAVSRAGPVGVDVEQCRPERDLLVLAESFFAEEERAALRALPAHELTDGFYRIWARKEAFIKAVGLGLGFGLTRFAVSSAAHDPRFVRIDPDARVRGGWRLVDVEVPRGYAAALVVPDTALAIEVRDWVG